MQIQMESCGDMDTAKLLSMLSDDEEQVQYRRVCRS
jgi:hypothetical protein